MSSKSRRRLPGCGACTQNAHEDILRALPAEFSDVLRAPQRNGGSQIEKLEQTLSNVLQFRSVKAVLAKDFDTELEQLYREQVGPPPRMRARIVQSAQGWVKARLDDALRRRPWRIPVEEFTRARRLVQAQLRLNGVRGFCTLWPSAATLSRQKCSLTRPRAHIGHSEFTAFTEVEPEPDNRRHTFVSRLFQDNRIAVAPLKRVEKFAEELRQRLQ